MKFHGIFHWSSGEPDIDENGEFSKFHGIPWNLGMAYFAKLIFNGIPRNILWNSMEFRSAPSSVKLSLFHGIP